VSGAPIVGQQLGAQTGIWQGVGSLLFGYGWYRCNSTGAHCKSIPGAIRNVYTLGARDSGRTIGLKLTASDSVGRAIAYASLVGPIAPEGATLSPVTSPTVTGTARVGGELDVHNGQWTKTPRRYTYTWLRCNRNARLCEAITDAAGASYRPVVADAGHTIVVEVTASAPGATQPVFTTATAPIVK
jgi:hypothetical protein